MRILLDGRYLGSRYPGVGRYVYNLARALPGAGVEVVLLVERPDEGRFPLAPLTAAGVELLATRAVPRGLAEQLVLRRIVARVGVDLVHVPWLPFAGGLPKPLVVTLHDAIGLEPVWLPSPWKRSALRFLSTRALRRARAAITVSQAAKRALIDALGPPAETLEVIAEAAAPEFRPTPHRGLRSRLGLPHRYALQVATAKPHKNVHGLVEAWRSLEPAGWELVLAGAGHRAPIPGARILGEVDEADLPALYSGAELTVVPSLAEGFGLPVLESMACGTPVACSRIASLTEVAGDAAAYFDPLSEASIHHALSRLLADADLRRELAERALVRVRRFSWAQAACETARIYRRALERSSQR